MVDPQLAGGNRPVPRHVYYGLGEKIFSVLPEAVLLNFTHPQSENALLWNLIYPVSDPSICLSRLLALPPLWGTAVEATHHQDDLVPHFWGYDVEGARAPHLDEVILQVDGQGPSTEVDLIFIGERSLIFVEVKNTSAPGRCSRYSRRRCPEMHAVKTDGRGCRYWEVEAARFNSELELGPKPAPGDEAPFCDRHYQLARTFLIGNTLAGVLGKEFHLWMIIPARHWRRIERGWIDFSDRVRDPGAWRRMRVIAWESIESLAIG